jgi:hypothetical protein
MINSFANIPATSVCPAKLKTTGLEADSKVVCLNRAHSYAEQSPSKHSYQLASRLLCGAPSSAEETLNHIPPSSDNDPSVLEDGLEGFSVFGQHQIRSTGAALGDKFLAMVPDIIEEDEAEALSLEIENRQWQGLRYQGEVYRLLESFIPSHRLQAFCLGQLLQEQMTSYLLTGSTERFAIWVNIKAIPRR